MQTDCRQALSIHLQHFEGVQSLPAGGLSNFVRFVMFRPFQTLLSSVIAVLAMPQMALIYGSLMPLLEIIRTKVLKLLHGFVFLQKISSLDGCKTVNHHEFGLDLLMTRSIFKLTAPNRCSITAFSDSDAVRG